MHVTISPESLDLEGLALLIDQTRGEGLRFDFKESLSGNDDRLAKCVAGFANADGGYLVFGVRDPERHPLISGQDLIVGVTENAFNNDFANKVRHKIEPEARFSILGHRLQTSDSPPSAVRFVEVPKSNLGPHQLTTSGSFPMRRSGGDTLTMTTSEVRSAVIGTLHIHGSLRMLRAYISTYVEVATEVHRGGKTKLAYVDELSVDPAEKILIDLCTVLRDSNDLFAKCFDVIQSAKRVNLGILETRVPSSAANTYSINRAESSATDVELWGRDALTMIDQYLQALD